MLVLFINVAIAYELPLDLKKKVQKFNYWNVYINQIANYILSTVLFAAWEEGLWFTDVSQHLE